MSDDDIGLDLPRRPKAPDPPERYVSPDGVPRDKSLEHKINEAFAITFRDAAGQEVLQYLRNISTNRIMGPGTPTDQIVYHEGARWLMGIIEKRVSLGEAKKP